MYKYIHMDTAIRCVENKQFGPSVFYELVLFKFKHFGETK